MSCKRVAGSSWGTTPTQILTHAGELQLNALDNCAAACACKAWRSAFSRCRIKALQLHADSASVPIQWGAFLSSRTAVAQLQLTVTQYGRRENQHPMSSSGLKHIPLKCQTLAADGMFADAIQETTDPSAELKQLFLDCGLRFINTPTSNPPVSFPVLTHLTQLKTLHLRTSCLDPNISDALALCLPKCPMSLQHLVLQAADWTTRIGCTLRMPEHLDLTLSQGVRQMLDTRLLKDLSLIQCFVRCTDSCGFFECLSTLTSLSLRLSCICGPKEVELTKMTNLECLDVSNASWMSEGWLRLDSFDGWSALKVLKIDKCEMFTPATVLNIPSVRELTLSHLRSGLSQETKVHVKYAGRSFPFEMITSAPRLPHLVSVHIVLSQCKDTAANSAAMIDLLILYCTSVQSLMYIADTDCLVKGQASLGRLDASTNHQLCDITLEGFCCSGVDLSGFASLTSVSLSRLDTPELPCKLVLPERVQSFSFCGTSLFVTAGNQCLLADLNCLTQLVLDPGKEDLEFMDRGVFVGQQLLHLPQLPGSLRHLHLKGPPSNLSTASNDRYRNLFLRDMDTAPPQVYIDVCDWQCLTGCTNLERLTLPLGYKLSGGLYAWVQAARHVHTVQDTDYDYDEIFGTPYLFS